jgi:type VI secretion system secreted protein Hcp
MSVDMFLQVDGVTGEATDSNHQGWLDIVTCTWGASQNASISGGGGGSGKVQFNDLRIYSHVDKATPALIKYCASGKHIPKIKVSVCKAGGTQIEYATIVLKDAIVTGANLKGASANQLMGIEYSFQGAQVEHHYWKQSKDGTKGAESQMGWDIKANTNSI